MPDRPVRLAQFNSTEPPPPHDDVQVLCEDHVGTYTLPFLCRWKDGLWINTTTLAAIEVEVIGWRAAPIPYGRRAPA